MEYGKKKKRNEALDGNYVVVKWDVINTFSGRPIDLYNTFSFGEFFFLLK